MKKKLLISIVLILGLSLTLAGFSAAACTNILVGEEASVDGSVFLGSSEDNSGVRNVLAWNVPGQEHDEDEVVELRRGGEIPQVSETNEYILWQNVGIEWSNAGINEHGVTLGTGWAASAVPEDFAEITDGGIGYMLRHLILERAETAREGVEIAADLLDEFGYAHVGRSYHIAGPDSAWVLQVTQGKQYAAKRVPDDEVAVVPNGFTIHEVDFDCEENYILSDDLKDFAIEYDFYDPEEDGPFEFAGVYGRPDVVTGGYNIDRQYAGIYLLTGEEPEFKDDDWHEGDWQLPFSVEPDRELDVEDITEVLDTHYEFDEETEYDFGYEEDIEEVRSPHHIGARTICISARNHGRVAQLRDDMPSEIGNLVWFAPNASCVSAYMPWYTGINETPRLWRQVDECFYETERSHLEYQFEPREGVLDYHPESQFHTFGELRYLAEQQYEDVIDDIQERWAPLQEQVYEQQDYIEDVALEMYEEDENKARNFLTNYTKGKVLQSQEIAEELIHEYKKNYMTN